jgi:hypothetical protein
MINAKIELESFLNTEETTSPIKWAMVEFWFKDSR